MVARIKTITDESVAYEVTLEGDEKAATMRQRLLRAATLADVEIAFPSGRRPRAAGWSAG